MTRCGRLSTGGMLREPFGGCDRGYNGTPPFQHLLVERHERRAQLCREGYVDRIGAAEQEVAGGYPGRAPRAWYPPGQCAGVAFS
jgi:hypothetical protein